ncbi:SMI1/KNR4 family protein [Streptomyces omiyaensis]|uniref:SMI1/KNR4 family protein n=1 Tax=Streptomyces omiyaensis TaxID=68247 RepID=A0ABW7C1L5_9ACTN
MSDASRPSAPREAAAARPHGPAAAGSHEAAAAPHGPAAARPHEAAAAERAAAGYVAAFAGLFGPPPEGPAIPVDWAAVEEWLGLPLPADYKAVATVYGPVALGERLWLQTPYARDPGGFDYGYFVTETRRMAPGVLPFAETGTSDTLFWDTTASDDPDAWPVVVHSPERERAGGDPWRHLGLPLLPALAVLVAEGLRPVLARSGLAGAGAGPWTPPPRRPAPTAAQRAALAGGGTGLDALVALLPPPPEPYLGERDWAWVHESLGTRLPAEYVRLAEAYGGGEWRDWLRLHLPLGTGEYDLVAWARWCTDNYRGLRASFPDRHPLAAWPEPGGLLPFASSIDGDQLCWLTEGDDPDAWPLVVVPRHAPQGPPLTGTLTGVLLSWLRGELDEEGLPRLLYPHEDPMDLVAYAPRKAPRG